MRSAVTLATERVELAELARRVDALEAKVDRRIQAPRALTQSEFARRFGVSRNTVWRQIRAGRLPFVTVGRRKLVLIPETQAAAP